jgi:peptidoglycan hydrolase-like protein with peptidoglycan-binding domain
VSAPRTLALAAAVLASSACAGLRERKGEKPAAEESAEVGPARVPATPQALLGAQTLARLQSALARRGYLGAHREGRLDEATRTAVRRFQADQGLARTGFPDRETLSRLGVDPDEGRGEASAGGR